MTQADMGLIARVREWFGVNQRLAEQNVTPRAFQVLRLARDGASRLDRAATLQHLAIALFSYRGGVAWNLILRLGFDMSALRQAVAAQESTTSMDSVLDLAREEKLLSGNTYLGTEHLLLALIRHRQNAVAEFLEQQGIDLTKAREQVLKELDPNFTGE
jgi:ATP-dependent Clp protease ATP-binding subunit ClpC